VRLVVVGPGRAGGSIALAAARSGHEVVAVMSRSGEARYGPPRTLEEGIPDCDLALIAVRDDAIEEVSTHLAGRDPRCKVAAHLSGFSPVTALAALGDAGVAIGGLHPLQTLPDPDRGAEAIPGSFAGVGGDPGAIELLTGFAESLGMTTFTLPDSSRPGYHAAAAAASNFMVTALATAADLLDAAGVEAKVMRPLVEQVVANSLDDDPDKALTGPIARGDIETVKGQLAAAAAVSPELGREYRLMAEATAIRAGRSEEVSEWS
jgi:predicted short-subunit dehydrogenase-like oxidoreductase (DUF2520 family)